MLYRGLISIVFVIGTLPAAMANDIVKYDISVGGVPVHSHGFVVNSVFKNLVEGEIDLSSKLGLQTCYMTNAVFEKISNSRHLGYSGFDELSRDIDLISIHALPKLKSFPSDGFRNLQPDERPRAEVIEIFSEGSSKQRRLMVAGARRVIPLCLAAIKSRKGFEQ